MNEPRYKLLWQTVAIFASMLIFASLRPSTADVTASDECFTMWRILQQEQLGYRAPKTFESSYGAVTSS